MAAVAFPAMSVAEVDGVQVIAAAVALVEVGPEGVPRVIVMLDPVCVIVVGVA